MVESLPELTGMPLDIGWQPHDWPTKLEGHWQTFFFKLQYAQCPFTQEQVPATVFNVGGAVVVCVASTMGAIYDTEMCRRASGITGWDDRWSAVSQVAELKAGALTAEGAKKVMLLHQLGTQDDRDQSSGKCVRCGRDNKLRATHLRHHCPEFSLRWVQAFHHLLKLDWLRGGVSDLEAWFVKGRQRLWISLIADGDLQWYLDGQGNFFTTGPLQVDHRASPVGVGPVIGGWSDSTPAHLEKVLDLLLTVVDTWKHEGHPWHRQQERGPTLPRWQSVLASWVVRGSRTWTLATKGALALDLPCLVADAEDPEVDVQWD